MIKIIVRVKDREEGTYVVVSDEFTVGRDATGNFIVLPNLGVSRTHARFYQVDHRWHIEDLGSANGVQVNGHNIMKTPLRHGDVIAIGPNHTLTFINTGVDPSQSFENTVRIDRPPRS